MAMKAARGIASTLFCVIALLSAACGSGDGESSTEGGDEKCYSVAVNAKNDGTSACGPKVCEAGTYCLNTVGICDPGCPDEFHCTSGQTCDMASPTVNTNGVSIGICRAPNADEETACSDTTGSATTGSAGSATTAGAESTTDAPTSTTPTSTTGTPSNCSTRCIAKVMECDGGSEIAQACGDICETVTEDDIACLEAKTCVEIDTAWESGMKICNFGP